MTFPFKEIKFKFLELIPLLLLFFISLNGNSVIDFKFFSINVHYILIYCDKGQNKRHFFSLLLFVHIDYCKLFQLFAHLTCLTLCYIFTLSTVKVLIFVDSNIRGFRKLFWFMCTEIRVFIHGKINKIKILYF